MFNEILTKITQRMEGQALGAILMDKEGISVEKHGTGGGFDVETTAMEYSVILKDVFKAAEMINAGEVSEMIVRNQQFSILLRVLDKTYFVALFVKPGGSVGKGRFVLRWASTELKKEML